MKRGSFGRAACRAGGMASAGASSGEQSGHAAFTWAVAGGVRAAGRPFVFHLVINGDAASDG